MTSEHELLDLITYARSRGVVVDVKCDFQAWISEGRTVIEDVQVSGIKGIGPFAMSALQAAEALRSYVASIPKD